jgi:hypothetical protein
MKLSTTLFAVACALPLAAAAQNVAIVNGKPVPKARVDTLMEQATRGGQQPRTPELEQRVRDEVVVREIFMQEAESRGLASTPEYQNQMELARQTLLIRELSATTRRRTPSPSRNRVPSTTSTRRRPAAPSTVCATSWSRRKTRPSPSSRS